MRCCRGFCGPGATIFLIFIVLLEFLASPLCVGKSRGIATKATTVTINLASISAISALASKAAVSATAGHTSTDTHSTFNTSSLISVRSSFLSLRSNCINVTEQLCDFLGSVSNVDTLILAIQIDIMKLPKHAEEGHVLTGIIYYSFGTVLHKELEQLEGLAGFSIQLRMTRWKVKYLVDLPPFFRALVCETLVYQRQNLVEELAGLISIDLASPVRGITD